MKKSDILSSLVMASALAMSPALLPGARAEPAASPSKASPPVMTDADDLSTPAAGGAPDAVSKNGETATPPAPARASPAAAPGAPLAKDVIVGAAVFASDGKKIGEVKGVKSESSGTVQEIHVTTGGLFGIGAKTVVVPASKIAKGGQNVQLAMTSAEVSKLPTVADTKG